MNFCVYVNAQDNHPNRYEIMNVVSKGNLNFANFQTRTGADLLDIDSNRRTAKIIRMAT